MVMSIHFNTTLFIPVKAIVSVRLSSRSTNTHIIHRRRKKKKNNVNHIMKIIKMLYT